MNPPIENKLVRNIAQRMSLRAPQVESLELVARIAEALPLKKDSDIAASLDAVRAIAPSVTDFERKFPSLAFAIATGVGKTRLMGAFIAYLANAKNLKHFLVISPNRTIYDKLTKDFTENTPKYVFKGLGTLVKHYVVTGDDFETKHGHSDLYGDIEVNVFNIAKLTGGTQGETKDSRRIRSLRETLGQSYFEYLKDLPDLVVIMDEAHRYRAQGAVDVLNELNPVLGLELTATPVISAQRDERFKNVVYSYPLAKALDDGFVKVPAVATRPDFTPADYEEDQLEQIKLEDAIRIHEDVKVQLTIYAEETGKPTVKPFILVIAENIEEATKHKEYLESPAFFEGRYKGKVIQVDSGSRLGEEKDDVVDKLLSVENPNNPIEIVVHVNMLKEGWDVTNLFTIVPLRAAKARVLVEQSIGRGLRLPYGSRTGREACDRLTIVAHDKFQEIIDDSKKPDSPIHRIEQIFIPEKGSAKVVALTTTSAKLYGSAAPGASAAPPAIAAADVPAAKAVEAAIEQIAAQDPNAVPNSAALLGSKVQGSLFDVVKATLPPETTIADAALKQVVKQVATAHVDGTIDIPRVVVYPDPQTETFGYDDFELDTSGINLQKVDREILVRALDKAGASSKIAIDEEATEEPRFEDYIIRGLVDYDEIDYDKTSTLLYKLAGQLVEHIKSSQKKPDGSVDLDAVRNILIVHQKLLSERIHQQMEKHSWTHNATFICTVTTGFRPVRPIVYQVPEGTQPRDVRTPVDDKLAIKSMIFTGFKKCLVALQKFDSDAERRLALVCEDDGKVLKWVKPARDDHDIRLPNGSAYHVDFIVETDDAKYMVEVKRSDQVNQDEVVAKATAARAWCAYANAELKKTGDKEWAYLLIPDNDILANSTIAGLAVKYGK